MIDRLGSSFDLLIHINHFSSGLLTQLPWCIKFACDLTTWLSNALSSLPVFQILFDQAQRSVKQQLQNFVKEWVNLSLAVLQSGFPCRPLNYSTQVEESPEPWSLDVPLMPPKNLFGIFKYLTEYKLLQPKYAVTDVSWAMQPEVTCDLTLTPRVRSKYPKFATLFVCDPVVKLFLPISCVSCQGCSQVQGHQEELRPGARGPGNRAGEERSGAEEQASRGGGGRRHAQHHAQVLQTPRSGLRAAG